MPVKLGGKRGGKALPKHSPVAAHVASSDVVTMDSEMIRAAADAGRERMKALDELMNTMRATVAASESFWQGPAGTYYRDEFFTTMEAFKKDLVECSTYVRELVAYADEYDGTVTEANVAANDVENAIWNMS